jgi:D-3-phosphoglycerate dehydrogenase / 2-oxoglutarate reductase
MKILVADKISESALDILKAEKSFEVTFLPKKTGAKVADEIRDADALIVRSATKVTAELLGGAPRLRVVGRAGVGVDNVDLGAATQKGVVVMNTPGGNAVAVAEHTLALLLALARQLPHADSSLKKGVWEKKKLLGIELRGKKLGLIGLGKVGMEVARLAQAFGTNVIAYDPYVTSRTAAEQGIQLQPLDDLLRSSDFISLHASLTPETRHLINTRTLALMKPGVRIINCARGELINEAELLPALESGQVAGAGLDVFETEPPRDLKLLTHPNVIATPHIAGSTEEAQEIVGIRIAEQVRDYLLEGVARNAVNLPSVSSEEYKKLEPYLRLGEKLGAFVAEIAGERLEEVRLSYDGGLAELNTSLVRNAALKGILSQIAEDVNLINAAALAQARGIEVVELRSARRADYSNSLGIALRTEAECCSALGMVGLRGGLRVLGINDIDVEAPLRGVILYIRNQDVPVVIGRVGTLLCSRRFAPFPRSASPRSLSCKGVCRRWSVVRCGKSGQSP